MTLNDGLVQTREADTGDRATPVVGLNYDFDSSIGKWVPRAAGSSSGGAGSAGSDLTTKSMVYLTGTNASVSLPAAAAGATALQMQSQGGDTRVTQDGTAATSSNGIIYYEGGIYDHPFADRTNTRLYIPTGVTMALIWKGPA